MPSRRSILGATFLYSDGHGRQNIRRHPRRTSGTLTRNMMGSSREFNNKRLYKCWSALSRKKNSFSMARGFTSTWISKAISRMNIGNQHNMKEARTRRVVSKARLIHPSSSRGSPSLWSCLNARYMLMYRNIMANIHKTTMTNREYSSW